MKKRILSVLLALCMCLTFVPVSVFAEDLQQDNGISVQSITPDEGTYYTYVFKANGETISTQIVKNDDTLLEPQVPAQDGKVFTGWTPKVTFGTVSGLTGENQTITVEAQFADGYPVYFMDDNGRVIATKTGKTGDTITFADVSFPVDADKAITGWYTDKDYTSKVESVTIASSSITLYAKVETGYWLTFESNGGSYVAPVFYANGTPAAAPTAPTKPGYAFDGWYTDEGLATSANFASITTSTTLYAKWTAANKTNYTVIHWQENVDDDKFSFMESETKTGTTGELTEATAKSYDGFNVRGIEQKTIAGDGSTIVNVYYERNVYTINFWPTNVSTTLICGKEEHTHSWWNGCYNRRGNLTCTKEEHTHDSSCYETRALYTITAKYGAYIGDQWPTYNGSNTWATTKNGDTYQVNIDTMPLNGANFYGPKTGRDSETAYYYVEVLPGETGTLLNGVTYREHHRDTSPGTGYSVTKEDKYPITGFTFKEGTQNGGKYNGAKFYYTRNSYNIVFVNNGATEKTVSKKFEQSIADVSYTPTAPVGKEGYFFAGWYDNELGEGNAYVFTGKTMPAQNITLYAKWVAPTYTVTVYDVDGSNVLKTFAKVAKNSTISSDDMPTPTLAEGEKFLGWVQEDGTPFSFSTKINQDYDLYAKVGNNSRYKVTYHSNTTPDATVTDDTMIYAKDVLATVKDNNSFTNGDKVFLSWNTRADGKGETYYPNGTIKVTGDMDLYAQWGRKSSTVTVTYHSNFGSDMAQSVAAVANNSKITVEAYDTLNLPERTGYSFAGWNTKDDGTGTGFEAGDAARVDDKEPNDLYAVWTINQYSYTVEYYIDGEKDDSLTETDKANFGTVIDSYKDKCPDGYVLDKDKVENLPLTIGADESANVIKVFYKKNVFDLTIHYVYDEGGTATKDHTASVTFGDHYDVISPTIDGYTADKSVVSGTMPAKNVEETVTYTKRSDLSYTVNYYWNGTTTKVYDSETVTGQTFEASVTVKPIAIDGYTPVSTASKTVDITTGENVINFYYYKNVKLTAKSGEATYDGFEHSVSGFAGAPEDADFSAITVGAKGIYAGTYDAKFAEGTVGTVDATNKYIVTVANNGALVITPVTGKVTVTITGNKNSFKYDGNEKTVSGYTVEISNPLYTTSDFNFTGTAEVKGTDVNPAGSYAMGLTADQFKNISKNFSNVEFVVATDGSLTITKRDVTLASGSDQKVYDGKPLTKDGITVSGDGFADGEGATYEVTGTITDVGSVKNEFTYKLNKDTKAGNYNITTEYGELKVTPATDKVIVTITGNTGSFKYDGSEKTVSGYTVSIDNELYAEKDFTFTGPTKVTGTDVNPAGSYAMGLTADQFKNISKNFSNVEFVVATDGSLTITKRDVTLASGSDQKVYDGKPLTKDGITVSGDGFADGEGASFDVTGTITDVGSVKNEFTYKLNENTKAGNYEITKEVGELEVTPVTDKVTVTITERSGSAKYDGTEHTVTGYDVDISNKLYTTGDFTFTGDATIKGTDADTYNMELKPSDFTNTNKNFSNVEFVIVDGTLVIEKRSVTLTSGSDQKVYDGNPLTNGTVSVTGDGFADGEGASFDVTGTITDVGKVDNAFTYTLNEGTNADNYNITKEVGKLEVTPVTDKVTVTITGNTKSETYDGTEKTVSGYKVVSISNKLYTEKNFALKEGVTDTVTKIDVGNYPMNLAFENISKNFTNVEFVVTDGSLEIKQRDVTFTGESATKTYNGEVQRITGITAEGLVEGHTYAGLTYLAEGKNPGKYDGAFSGRLIIKDADGNDVTRNYKVTTVNGVLTINRRYQPTPTPDNKVSSPKTADSSQMTLWMSMTLASAAGIVFFGKKRKEEQ